MNKIMLVIVLIIMLGGWFYWFQYRPAKIKHDCSWIKKHKDAIPEKPAQNIYDLPKITYRQLLSDSTIQKCDSWSNNGEQDYDSRRSALLQALEKAKACEETNNRIIKSLGIMKPAESAKDWWIKAPKEYYQFCLHDRGL